jgi:uracil-DNA glycosylase
MRVSKRVTCSAFPCSDVRHECCRVPDVEIDPEGISIVMIAEAAPQDPADYYYAKGDPLFQQTTVQAFQDAGSRVSSVRDILDLGVYLTTAVKCGKTDYAICTTTIKECSLLLEKDLDLFSKTQVILLMGDVAIRAVNYIAQRSGNGRVIPSGSTYKIRGQEYRWKDRRLFPSYLQAGPSFFIEKTKRKMIAQDIADALRLVK